MQQDNVLTLSGFRYLKLSLLVVLTCIVLYFADTPPIRPGGGTWLGYGLGTLGAVLIVWLMLFGLRKRAYSSNLGTVRGWLSAHVYLGLSLIVIATLHAAFHFGVNIHTLAYVLTLLVVFSGLWGLFGYMSIPSKMNGLLKGKTLDQSAEALTDIDTQSQRMVGSMSAEIKSAVEAAAKTHFFDYPGQRLFSSPANCATAKSVALLTSRLSVFAPAAGATSEAGNAARKVLQELHTLQLRRLAQLNNIREYLRLKAQTETWLMLHVPLTFALFAALGAHILSVFFYW
jgi:hypothetical protein